MNSAEQASVAEQPSVAAKEPAQASLQPHSAAALGSLGRCDIRKCRLHSAELFDCSEISCSKQVHVSCCESFVTQKHSLQPLIDPANNQALYACSKTCYSKLKRTFVDQPARIAWNRDGQNGPQDPNSSEKILLDWLCTEGNYNRYRGKNNNGTTKLKFCQEISRRISDAGCRVSRTPEMVQQKIKHLEKLFTEAHDWASNTGQGVLECDGQATFDEAIQSRCAHYHVLLPIMVDFDLSDTSDEEGGEQEEVAESVASK